MQIAYKATENEIYIMPPISTLIRSRWIYEPLPKSKFVIVNMILFRISIKRLLINDAKKNEQTKVTLKRSFQQKGGVACQLLHYVKLYFPFFFDKETRNAHPTLETSVMYPRSTPVHLATSSAIPLTRHWKSQSKIDEALPPTDIQRSKNLAFKYLKKLLT